MQYMQLGINDGVAQTAECGRSVAGKRLFSFSLKKLSGTQSLESHEFCLTVRLFVSS